MSLSFDSEQRFECRDCVSRCCAMPWVTVITREEKERLESREWIQEQLRTHGTELKPHGPNDFKLPMLERHRRLECLFLDEDGLCSIHRKEGHEFLATSCQMFPFEFVSTPEGETVVALSHLCPSIRDNYGHPLAQTVEKRFDTIKRQAQPMSATFTLGHQTKLTTVQAMRIIARWETVLETPGLPLAEKLMHLYDFTAQVQEALRDQVSPSDEKVNEEIQRWSPQPITPPVAPKTFLPNLLLALALYPIAYPARVAPVVGFSMKRAISGIHLISKLVRHRGEIDLLYVTKPFPLESISSVASAAAESSIQENLSRFLAHTLKRRNLFVGDRHLLEILLDLALSYAMVLRFARYRAAAEGRTKPIWSDAREGVSVAEFTFLFHANMNPSASILELLRGILADNRLSFENIVYAER